MKDILFTVKQQKREIGYVSACLFVAIGINVYAIISYGTDWKELYTQWYTVLMLAVFLYFVAAFFRLIIWLIFKVKGRKK